MATVVGLVLVDAEACCSWGLWEVGHLLSESGRISQVRRSSMVEYGCHMAMKTVLVLEEHYSNHPAEQCRIATIPEYETAD
jgi:hypothetical protein